VRGLQSRAVRELQIEIDKFALMESTPVEDFVWAGVQLLDVVTHLETLEIFSML
jgi:C6 transcription factor Pro1